MPLIMPGMQSKSNGANSSTEEWQNKLMGKKLGDKHDFEARWSCFFLS